jgi:hypothetical protein
MAGVALVTILSHVAHTYVDHVPGLDYYLPHFLESLMEQSRRLMPPSDKRMISES